MMNRTGIIAVINSSEDFAARKLWNKSISKKDVAAGRNNSSFLKLDASRIAGVREVCALKMAAYTMQQFLAAYDEGKVDGHLALVLPDNVHIRACEARKHLKVGVDSESIISAMTKSWMDESYTEAITSFVEQFAEFFGDDARLSISTYSRNTLRHWRIAGDNLAAGMEIELSSREIDGEIVSATADGEILCENNAVSGKFIVESYMGRDSQGRPVEMFSVPRVANVDTSYGATLHNVQVMDSEVADMLPKIEAVDSFDSEEMDGIAL